jgi:uncharacterized protein YebE (UPF0316 family)
MQQPFPELWPLIGIPLLVFFARVVDVTLGTIRIVLVARGHKTLAPLIGFFEILAWLVALGQVVQHLNRPLNFVAYAGGFATGTWIGLQRIDKTVAGYLSVRVITPADATELVTKLRSQQFGVTTVAARGVTDRVRLLFSVIRRQDLDRLLKTVRTDYPKAFISVSDVRLASEGYFSPGSFGLSRLMEPLKRK